MRRSLSPGLLPPRRRTACRLCGGKPKSTGGLGPPSVCRLSWMYSYGTLFHMKKTLHIDERLLAEAREVSGAATDTEAVRLGLEALLRHAAYERLRALRGAEPTAQAAPRRRERSARKRRAA